MTISKTVALGQTRRTPNKNLASRQGLEPRPTVLETGMLPLHQRDTNFGLHGRIRTSSLRLPKPAVYLVDITHRLIWWTVTGSNRSSRLAKPVCPQQHLQPIFFNTLLRMCVLKSTVCDIAVQVSSMLFNTLPFYTLALSPLAYHPVGRPHLQFRVMPARVAIALKEKPRGF